MFMKWIAAFLLLAVTACGFTPLYATLDDKQVTNKTAEINIVPIDNYMGYLLQTNLRNQLNPEQIKAPQNYDLIVTLPEPLISDQNIQEDFFSSRERIIQKADYKLIDRKTKQVLIDTTTSATGSYNITLEPYATYMSKERVRENLIKILAQTISTHVISYMRKEVHS